MSVNAGPNPYVGPKPFEPGQRLFGRDREAAEIGYLLTSERIVLLYAPSGAGKSSLVQAGLLPRLEKRFDLWGTTRVGQTAPAEAGNRYVWSAISGLEKSSAIPANITLAEYAAQRPREQNPLIVFDQFEEVLRVDPVDIKAKRAFFEQLGEMLRDPSIWALFVLREDYLAPLDPFRELIPTHLQNRYRLDRLTCEMAAQAIAKPMESTPRKYAPGVVDTMVENLARMKVQQLDGSFREESGHYIEPLQLQVVCLDLWDRMDPEDMLIDPEDVGDIGDALSNYYAHAVRTVAEKDETAERHIRQWFQNKLITSDGIRNQVRQEAGQSGGLEERYVHRLVDTYIVRAEPRGGTTWFELSHDRLIKPVQEDNRKWFDEHLSKLQRTAALWEQDKPDGLLFLGRELVKARIWAANNRALMTAAEEEFLKASTGKNRGKLILRALSYIAVVATLAALAGGFSYWREAGKVRVAMAQASVDNAQEALLMEGQQGEAVALAQLARAMRNDAHSQQARAWISGLLARKPWWLPLVSFEQKDMTSSDMSHDGLMVATGSKDGSVQLWDASSGQRLTSPLKGQGRVDELFFDESGNRLMVISGHYAQVWNTKSFQPIGPSINQGSDIVHAHFSWDSQRALTTSDVDNSVQVWNTSTGQLVGTPLEHEEYVNSAEFSRDGRWVVTASDDGNARIWNIEEGKLLGSTPEPERDKFGSLPLRHASLSHDGAYVVTASDQDARVWAVPPGAHGVLKLQSTLKHDDTVRYAEFSPVDEETVVTSSYDNTAKIWKWRSCDQGRDAQENACKGALTILPHEGSLWGAGFSEDGKRIATGSFDNSIQIWDAENGRPIGGPIPYASKVNGLGFSHHGKRILISSEGAGAQIWKLEQPSVDAGEWTTDQFGIVNGSMTDAGLRGVGSDNGNLRLLQDLATPVLKPIPSLTWDRSDLAQDGQHTILYRTPAPPLDPDNETPESIRYIAPQVWDFSTGQPIGPTLPNAHELVPSVNALRVLIWNGNKVTCYDAVKGKVLGSFSHEQILLSRFSHDGNTVVTLYSGGVQVWDPLSGKKIGKEIKQGSVVYDAQFSRNGKWLATASADHTACLWNVLTGEMVGKPMAHGGKVISVQFSPDPQEKYILTETENHRMQVWDVKTRKKMGATIHLGNATSGLIFSPDGTMIVTSSPQAAQLWDASTGKKIGEAISQDQKILTALFTSDGRKIVTYSNEDEKARVYRIDLGSGSAQDNTLLANLAEIAGGYKIDDKTGAPEVIEPKERLAQMQALREKYKIDAKETFLETFVKRLSDGNR